VTRLAAIALVILAALVAPACALAGSAIWTDAAGGLPSSVQLRAVAAYGSSAGDVVLAVGEDASDGQAVIARYAAGSWYADTVAGAGTPGCLVAVAIDAQAAWAVGSAGGCDGSGAPLLLRFPGGGAALASVAGTADWQAVAAPAALASPRAVALDGAAGGYIADSAGNLVGFSDASTPSFSPASFTPQQTSPTALSGVALYGAQTGYAVGAPQAGEGIFGLSSSGNMLSPFAPPAQPGALAGVAALSASDAIAIDGPGTSTPGWWAPNANGVWQRSTGSVFNGSSLQAVSIGQASPSAAVAEAIAGADAVGHGAVWQRSLDQASFTETTVSCRPLRGIAVIGATDMWAVGDGGTVLHFAPSDGASAGCSPSSGSGSGGGAATNTGGGSTGGTQQGTGSGTQGGSSAQTVSSHETSSGIQVTVSQPAATAPGSSRGHRHRRAPRTRRRSLLVSNVRVRVELGQLLVACRLSGPARVSAIAITGARVVGRARWQSFRGGTCRLVVPFRGTRPPARLRIVALPLTPATGRRA
jgi:hypothetical protein